MSQQASSSSAAPTKRPATTSPENNPPSIASSAATTSAAAKTTAVGGGGEPKNAQPPAAKKKRRFYTPVSVLPPHTASTKNVVLLHQNSCLEFVLQRSPPHSSSNKSDYQWFCQGKTSLYVLDEKPPAQSENNAAVHQLALHVRATCKITSATVECCSVVKNEKKKNDKSNKTSPSLSFCKLKTSYHQLDPLQHVLIKPPTSFAAEDGSNNNMDGREKKTCHYRFNGDSQSSRGAAGITTGLRAASMASNMGELRMVVEKPQAAAATTTPDEKSSGSQTAQQQQQEKREIELFWQQDLLGINNDDSSSNEEEEERELAVERAQEHLSERSGQRRQTRVELIARRLAQGTPGSSSNNNNNSGSGAEKLLKSRAFKITLRYKIPMNSSESSIFHMGGLHVLTTNRTPHVYTTAGVFGDHEGTRCWLPCLDSASCKHRASQQLTVKVTAPLREGLSCVGMGEDFGYSQAFMHDDTWNLQKAKQELGNDHVDLIQTANLRAVNDLQKATNAHIIPPEGPSICPSIDSMQVTSIWSSCSWTPISARSLGFAIGPFKVLEDPEYFGPSAVGGDNDDDDDESVTSEERHEAFAENARRNGEGIRNVYFALLSERKYIHSNANMTIIPNTRLQLSPLSAQNIEMSENFDDTVIYATIGVPHRALSLMRDVLALPAYRTVSYTQVWIPNAVHGGTTSGALHFCPEVLINPFLGGSIMDARLLPPVGSRLPFYQGGRVLQFLQARCAIRGWILAALPLGGDDDVGFGYIHSLIEAFIMSMYERGHGAYGEGGAKGGVFFSERYGALSGLNNVNLDFLPVQNIEDSDIVIAGIGAVPVEDRHNDQLWRSPTNGTESHTSATDEFNIRQLLCKDAVEAFERGTDKDKGVPSPSMGWLGSHLSLSFLSSNATSSCDLGCGAVDMLHPVGGLVYRSLKCSAFRGVVEGRAGVANFLRLIRATFIASHLDDLGETELTLPNRRDKKPDTEAKRPDAHKADLAPLRAPFVVCVNEILKKKGLTHTLFTRALQNLSGRIKEPHLLGTLVDVERNAEDPRTRRPFVEPEGFPNSYVRGASFLYCRVGVQVEAAEGSSAAQSGIQMQAYAEPVIPEGGIAYGGPITLRVVENEGQFREFVKDLAADGSRRDWGATFLHAKPVTKAKAQTAASGTIDVSSATSKTTSRAKAPALGVPFATCAFTDANFHKGGYQAIELIRLTNRTPLLWVRVDPVGIYCGRFSVFQPDACLAEQLFHDGDAAAQVDAMRALSERPLLIQGSVKVTAIYDVSIAELPVRVLGDCLRGSPALHSSLPHTPVVRSQAAAAIAQWENNKAPPTKDSVGPDYWVGSSLLFQYFRERFYSSSMVMPVKFSRLVLRKSEAEIRKAAAAVEGGGQAPTYDDSYEYLDTLEEGEERAAALEDAEEIEIEEDEEYRVRSSVVTALACIRAKDGMTPKHVINFLETILEAEDAEMVGHLVYPDEELMIEKKFRKTKADASDESEDDESTDGGRMPSLSYVSSVLVADALLALCHVNVSPAVIMDPATGKPVQISGNHPVTRLMEIARGWLEWELYREKIRFELAVETCTGISGNCHDIIAACAVSALSMLAILRKSTTDSSPGNGSNEVGVSSKDGGASQRARRGQKGNLDEVSQARFYVNIFDGESYRNDLTKAACAQAIACICCAADRFEQKLLQPVGLLSALEFMLERIIDNQSSPSLRNTLSLIMMDACTGKVCSMQRVGAIAGRNDLITSSARFMNGPLGASHGGDNGSAAVMSVSARSFPAANAVNDGARRGLRLLSRAGHPKENVAEDIIVRVAVFATRLWRTINGEPADQVEKVTDGFPSGVCAYDGALRCSLLALWQWIWPRGCFAVLQVQAWKVHEGTERYFKLGADRVMKISDEEKAAATAEEHSLADINRLVNAELDRQIWRGEMAKKAFEFYKSSKGKVQDVAAAEKGIGQPLPPIQRDTAFKQGGWTASAAQQRRALALDGGTAVTKVRLKVKSNSGG